MIDFNTYLRSKCSFWDNQYTCIAYLLKLARFWNSLSFNQFLISFLVQQFYLSNYTSIRVKLYVSKFKMWRFVEIFNVEKFTDKFYVNSSKILFRFQKINFYHIEFWKKKKQPLHQPKVRQLFSIFLFTSNF